jgi:hypothetical protein|tara:strand:+ start:915 stop:1502 length:588 start_codon:yes stop_codon:yes gene_type:complete
MKLLKSSLFLGTFLVTIGAFAERDLGKKDLTDSSFKNANIEKVAKIRCSVHSEFTKIYYGGPSYLKVESCFGGEDNGTRYIKVVEDPRGICVFPTQLSGRYARYNFWFQAYDYRGKRLFDYDKSQICGKSGHEMVVKNMPTNFLLIMDPATVDGFLKCLDRATNGYNELRTVYSNITRSCKEVEGVFYSIHGLSS